MAVRLPVLNDFPRTGPLPAPVYAENLAAFSDEYEKKEKCGVFGIWGTRDATDRATRASLPSSIAGRNRPASSSSDGTALNGHAGMGLVSQVFNPRMLREELAGHAAIGHVRYSTTGSSKLCNAQPLLRSTCMGPVAVAHNGNLINAQLLRRAVRRARPHLPEHDRHRNHRPPAGQADAP